VAEPDNLVLVTGGAGYIGSTLVRLLLDQGYAVRVLDSLLYGGEPILDLVSHPAFSLIKGDIRDPQAVEKSMQGVQAVAHLAAIVGDPACAKNPGLTREVNLQASQSLYLAAERQGAGRFVFISTCSNYGKMADSNSFVSESSQLAPISLYAETKVAVEKFLLEHRSNRCKPTCLRFSTVYGLSLRPRFDLTVNEFAKELALGRQLEVFGGQFWRPYCHVKDLARAVQHVLEAPLEKVAFEVFNVGDTRENYQKQMIVDEVVKQLPDSKVRYVERSEDPRDYRVSFDKIASVLGFQITYRVPDGIREVVKAVRDGMIEKPDDPKYRNTA